MVAGRDAKLSNDRPNIWALASGKGGVGKSLLAANLACLLAESEWPTTAVDLDLHGANLHTLLGVGRPEIGVSEVLCGERSVQEVRKPHSVPGLSYIGGHGERAEHTTHEGRSGLVAQLSQLSDKAVILDLGTGTADSVLDFFVAADVPLLIVTPEPASVENAYRFLRSVYLYLLEKDARKRGVEGPVAKVIAAAHEAWKPLDLEPKLVAIDPGLSDVRRRFSEGRQIGLVLNQVRTRKDVGLGFAMVGAVKRHFGFDVGFLTAIPWDPNLWLSIRRRKLMRRGDDDEFISEGLACLADNVIEGGGLTSHDDVALPEAGWLSGGSAGADTVRTL